MGCMSGGTQEDFAQNNIKICFAFESKGTKKLLETIFKERNVTSLEMKDLYKQEAEKMVTQKYSLSDEREIYIFAKDKQNFYFWKPVTFKEKVIKKMQRVFYS